LSAQSRVSHSAWPAGGRSFPADLTSVVQLARSSPPLRQLPVQQLERDNTAIHQHDGHRVDKACCRHYRRAEESVRPRIALQLHVHDKLMAMHRGYPRRDERRQTAASIPRLVRTSSDPTEPVSARGVLPAVEVRGTPTSALGLSFWELMRVQNERHSYEKCQYDEFKERVKKMDELREAKGGQRSN
jgi:hypothetical protein